MLKANQMNNKLRENSTELGNLLVDGFHILALFAIGTAIVLSACTAFSIK